MNSRRSVSLLLEVLLVDDELEGLLLKVEEEATLMRWLAVLLAPVALLDTALRLVGGDMAEDDLLVGGMIQSLTQN